MESNEEEATNGNNNSNASGTDSRTSGANTQPRPGTSGAKRSDEVVRKRSRAPFRLDFVRKCLNELVNSDRSTRSSKSMSADHNPNRTHHRTSISASDKTTAVPWMSLSLCATSSNKSNQDTEHSETEEEHADEDLELTIQDPTLRFANLTVRDSSVTHSVIVVPTAGSSRSDFMAQHGPSELQSVRSANTLPPPVASSSYLVNANQSPESADSSFFHVQPSAHFQPHQAHFMNPGLPLESHDLVVSADAALVIGPVISQQVLVPTHPFLSTHMHQPEVHTQIDFEHKLVPDLLQITNCGYYWGKIDRYEAERLLDRKAEGTFLLRDSAQDDFVFSLSFRRFDRSLHARIEQQNNLFSFDHHDQGVFKSETVTGLIDHYKNPNNCVFFEPCCFQPVLRPFPFSLGHLARAAITARISYSNINRLPLPKDLKNYLKEYHYKQPVEVRSLDIMFRQSAHPLSLSSS